MGKRAYIDKNTKELRDWLKSVGLTPVTYPDEDRQGLTAPYPDCSGGMTHYYSGRRFEDDDDADEHIFCSNEEEFKETVLKFI